ncbi:MAG: S41 family peptidase [Candidatus Moranbacteria bacterium]|nr:S41 family peptidase [Candidatus Moranbacteria bacterium]
MDEIKKTDEAVIQVQEIDENTYLKQKKLFHKSFLFFLVVFLIGGSFFLGYKKGQENGGGSTGDNKVIPPSEAIFINKDNSDKTIDFSLFWKVWSILREKYVDKANLDSTKLFYGAIDGMLAATGDPYTTFFSPEENAAFKEDISGTFSGIGAEMGLKDEVITVIAPLDESPAEKAGLLAGDRIIQINGESTTNLSLDDAVKKIRGEKGTEVKLTIFRDGEEATREVAIVRDTIVVKSVRFEMKENNIALIRVSRFGDDTTEGFADAVKQAKEKGAQGIVVDLRNNPGGYLEAAVSMGSLMLPAGKIVVMEETSNGTRKEMKTKGGDMISSLKTVVLINQGSASASEILAGALRENRDNITLVGKKSFGKGSVQELIPVTKDTAVKVTVAKWLTPKGNQINHVGISPDVEVDITRDDLTAKKDPQMDKALELLK